VGPGISVHLDIPQITFVKKIEEITEKMLRAQRMTEEGYDVVSSEMPCLITVVKEINEPRLPSLRGKMKAKSAVIKKITNKELGLDPKSLGLEGSPTVVHKIFSPPTRQGGQMLEGETPEMCDKLVQLLTKEL
jgi:electron transfer flavoprotein beta subunit